MRVLHLDTERTWRGGEQQVLYLVSGLAARGHEPLVAAPPGAAILQRVEALGLPVAPIGMRGELDLVALWRLATLVRRFRPDVLHMHTAHAHSLGVLACALAPGPSRVVSRRVDFPIGRLSARWKYQRGVDRFLAITAEVARVLRAAGVSPDRIRIVRSGIDPARLASADRARGRRALGLEANARVVGTVAHFAWHKGLVHLVHAWPDVIREEPGAVLVLVGDGEDASMLRDAVRTRGIEASVMFAGFRTDVPDCLAAFDCFVLPSVLEGLGTSILDALTLERPVVASRTGGIPEIIAHEETGLLVEPGDPPGLAKAVLRMLRETDRAMEMARAGRRRVLTTFSADSMVEQTLAAYREATR